MDGQESTQLFCYMYAAHNVWRKLMTSIYLCLKQLYLFLSSSGPIKPQKKGKKEERPGVSLVVSSFQKGGKCWKQLSIQTFFKSRRQDDWISIHCTSLSLNGLIYLCSQYSVLTYQSPCTESLMDAGDSVKRRSSSCGWGQFWNWT